MPAEAIAPNPTPNPTPAAPPAPAPKPVASPAPTPTPEPSQSDEDPFVELDRKLAAADKKKEPEQPPSKDDEGGEPKEPVQPQGKQPKPIKSEGGKLREELERTKSELKTRQDAVSKMEARIAELESRGADTTKLTERLTALEKERDDVKAELAMAKAEVSDEFKAKWDKPFDAAAEYAKSVVTKLNVGEVGEDPNTGERKFIAKGKASWEQDFAKIYNWAKDDPAGAMDEAEKMFGARGGQIVMQHVSELQRLDRSRAVALEEEKASWKEKAAQREAEKAKQTEGFKAGSQAARDGFIKKYPDLYDEDPNDPEGNEILKESRRLMAEQPKTFQQAVILHARNKLNAEAAPRLAYRVKKLTAELEDAKATIEAMKKGKPGPGERTSQGTKASTPDDDLAELDKIDFSH